MKQGRRVTDGPRLRARIAVFALAACLGAMVAPSVATHSTPVAPIIQQLR